MVVYPASLNLQTERSELSCSTGKMSSSRALSFRLVFGSNAFSVVLAVVPVGIPTCLLEGLPVLTCSSSSRQKLDVAAESKTAVAFRFRLFMSLRAHLRVILFVVEVVVFTISWVG